MDSNSQIIKKKLDFVLSNIEKSTRVSGRKMDQVQLVVVTKLFSVDTIRLAALAGVRNFGENYPEEALEKISSLSIDYPDLKWHMIGHCQSRKVKIIADKFHYFHSLDGLDLAIKLSRLCSNLNKKMPVLLEMNVGGELRKQGWIASNESNWDQLIPDVQQICDLPGLDVRGLMTMPPYQENPENSRSYFRKLVKLRDFFSNQIPGFGFAELSMGTSIDYQVAIEEGATYIRIGEAILGPRNYS